jgi:hypothetical protein
MVNFMLPLEKIQLRSLTSVRSKIFPVSPHFSYDLKPLIIRKKPGRGLRPFSFGKKE